MWINLQKSPPENNLVRNERFLRIALLIPDCDFQ
jgi:hypothetical protein